MRRLCLAIIAVFALVAPAAAGGCCGGGYEATAYEVQPVVPVATYRFPAPPPVRQIYVVNQGPVLSGPGLYTYTNYYEPSIVPPAFAYIGGCGGCDHAVSYGCGATGGCGQAVSYGCCGQTYGYGYSYGCCGRGLWSSPAVAPEPPYGGYRRSYWRSPGAGHRWSGTQRDWHRYHVWLHRHAPRAGTVAPAPSSGY
jgi:hypothetical protein